MIYYTNAHTYPVPQLGTPGHEAHSSNSTIRSMAHLG